MKRVLVIALTRLGDLLQTEPAIRALKSSGRSSHVTVLIERSFADIASRLEGVDHVETVDFTDVLATLDRSCARLPLTEYAGLMKVVARKRFDEVWNVTHTRPSMVLAALANPSNSHGVTLDRRGLQIVRNEWLTYFFATNLARPWCAHNLVDIYVNAVNPAVPFAERIPRLKGVKANRKAQVQTFEHMNVLVHPGASQADKQWPTERFVKLVGWLNQQGARATLIGGKKELQLAGHFPQNRRVECRIGRTTIDELIELCNEASLLVSGDSGPVHVAAACGLPILSIEGGSAHAHETAPYGIGSLILQPHLPNVLERTPDKFAVSGDPRFVEYETVRGACEYFLGSEWPGIVNQNVSVYRTRSEFRFPGLMLKALNSVASDYDVVIDKLRTFWRSVLADDEKRRRGRAASELSMLLGECSQATECIYMESRTNALIAAAHALTDAERKLTQFLTRKPWLHHLEAYLRIARSSLESDNSATQAAQLASLYDRMARACEAVDIENPEVPFDLTEQEIEVSS